MNAWRTLPQRLLDRRLVMSRHPHANSDHRIHPREINAILPGALTARLTPDNVLIVPPINIGWAARQRLFQSGPGPRHRSLLLTAAKKIRLMLWSTGNVEAASPKGCVGKQSALFAPC
jgi:hypothetical protein